MSDSTPLRLCGKCKRFLPATTEVFSKHPRGKYGLYSICRECMRNDPRRHVWIRNTNARRKDKAKAYREAHKEQKREYDRQYNLANREKKRAQSSALQKKKRYEVSEYHKRWRKENPDKFHTIQNRRKARKRNQADTLTAADWQYALDYFNGRCAVCGRSRGLWHYLAQDHWIPLSKGGGTTPDNIVPLCHSTQDGQNSCNNAKHNSDPEEWLVRSFGEKQATLLLARIQAFFEEVRRRDTFISGL